MNIETKTTNIEERIVVSVNDDGVTDIEFPTVPVDTRRQCPSVSKPVSAR